MSTQDTEAEQHKTRLRVREVLEREVLPFAEQWEDQGYIDRSGWISLAEAGLFALPHAGPGFLDSAVFLEELGRTGYAGIRAAIGVHAYMAPSYLIKFGSARQQEIYLPAIRRAERIAALALSEEGAGTDLGSVRTRAEPDENGGYLLSGRKLHVANGSQAGLIITLARVGPAGSDAEQQRGLSRLALFAVDARARGVAATPEPMLGWRTADVCTVDFDDVRLPGDAVIGKPGRTLIYLAQALEFERLVAGLLAVGGTAFCVSLLDEFARSHRINGAALSANQAVRHRVADLSADLALVEQYGRYAAQQHALGRLDARVASILKLKATELAVTAAQACMQLHGARGYAADSAAARVFRDAAAGTIAAGPSELMRELIFESR